MRGSPAVACFELARLANSTRSGRLGGVVGMDLAGDELHYNNSRGEVEQCLLYAKRELLLNTTVHAGEMSDDEAGDVRSAIEVMRADRVGHGYAAVRDFSVLALLMRSGVHLEACPAGHHDNLHATGVYREHGLNFGLSTDDPAEYFANITMGGVDALVEARLKFSDADVARAYRSAYAARFAPHAARIVSAAAAAAQHKGEHLGGGGGGKGALPLMALVALALSISLCLLVVLWTRAVPQCIGAARAARRGGGDSSARRRRARKAMPAASGLPPEHVSGTTLEMAM